MKKADVKIGSMYMCKVTNKVVAVRIDEEHPQGGWSATNLTTNKKVRIKSAQRLRGAAPTRGKASTTAATTPRRAKGGKKATAGTTAKAKATRANLGGDKATPKRRGILDIAAEILAKAKEPMSTKAIVEVAIEKGLWKTTGKTPAATLYAAVIREIAAKAREARFEKVDRGLFQAPGKEQRR